VPLEDFLKLTKIPIQIVVGDNIPSSPQPIPQLETPRIRLIFKKQFVETVNRNGGDASLLRLPDVGIYGNTHAPFLDLKHLEVADSDVRVSFIEKALMIEIIGRAVKLFILSQSDASSVLRRVMKKITVTVFTCTL